jgi:hypothetical protein
LSFAEFFEDYPSYANSGSMLNPVFSGFSGQFFSEGSILDLAS